MLVFPSCLLIKIVLVGNAMSFLIPELSCDTEKAKVELAVDKHHSSKTDNLRYEQNLSKAITGNKIDKLVSGRKTHFAAAVENHCELKQIDTSPHQNISKRLLS